MAKSNPRLAGAEEIPSEVPRGDIGIKELFSNFKKQVQDLKAERNKIEKSLQGVINQIKSIQDEQLKLRDSISSLVKKETDLNKNRIDLEKKLTDIKNKYSKLVKIHSELADIWK